MKCVGKALKTALKLLWIALSDATLFKALKA